MQKIWQAQRMTCSVPRQSATMSTMSLRRASAMLGELEGGEGTLRMALAPTYSPIASWLAAHAPPGHAWGWLGWQAGRYWPRFLRAAAWNPADPSEPGGRLQLRPDVLEQLAREHAQSLYANHSQMAAKLAEANAAGEIGRKEEMKRIFGIDV